MAGSRGVPTLRPVLHHDWTRRFFRHRPEAPHLADHLDASYCYAGTVLDAVLAVPEGPGEALAVGYDPEAGPARRRLLLWHGDRRLVEETLTGFFHTGYGRLRGRAVEEVARRLGSFVVLHPTTEPTYVVGLDDFAAAGVSHATLERVLDAPVAVATQAPYAEAAYVPSLRVYVPYDGARYGDSSKKLFYDRNGHAVPVELVAREVLARLAYDAVPPTLFGRLFTALAGRPPSHFRPDRWVWTDPRRSPLTRLATTRERLAAVATQPVEATEAALRRLAQRPPYRDFARPEGALPLVARFATRRRLTSLLETLGGARYAKILEGLLAGHRVVEADWFAWQADTRRAFPVEVKSRGDTLRPSQKESILWCQATGLLEYRLLEVLHGPAEESLPEAAA